jgi:hypothetical protein
VPDVLVVLVEVLPITTLGVKFSDSGASTPTTVLLAAATIVTAATVAPIAATETPPTARPPAAAPAAPEATVVVPAAPPAPAVVVLTLPGTSSADCAKTGCRIVLDAITRKIDIDLFIMFIFLLKNNKNKHFVSLVYG